MKMEKSEQVFHDWLHANCNKGQILRVWKSDKIFVVSPSDLKLTDLMPAYTLEDAPTVPAASTVPEKDELFDLAVDVVRNQKRVSTGLLIRALSITYIKATLLIDPLEAHGIIGPKDGAKPRKVL